MSIFFRPDTWVLCGILHCLGMESVDILLLLTTPVKYAALLSIENLIGQAGLT
jgi:uncharacterized membrane protein